MTFLKKIFTFKGYFMGQRLQNAANKFDPNEIIGDQAYRYRIECNLL